MINKIRAEAKRRFEKLMNAAEDAAEGKTMTPKSVPAQSKNKLQAD